ncbi:MAG: hypothetical protein FWC16_11595 [Defluviitaleaceae bacterium]|nr:hypothetical protein [Defluviitaleaceae bacterium]MCL2275562.1 hypothetical protein [Defluviitaleaceae bacterium]
MHRSLHEETRLIRRVQKRGDKAAADALIRTYYDEIYRYGKRQTNTPHWTWHRGFLLPC